jgi:hypothetical protein
MLRMAPVGFQPPETRTPTVNRRFCRSPIEETSMPKVLCIFGMVVAALMLLIFGLDIAIGFPFRGAKPWMMDLPLIVCSAGLGYLSWVTLREQI